MSICETIHLHLIFKDYLFLESCMKCPHEVANFLKIFLRGLDEPLCTNTLYQSFMQITKNDYPDRAKRLAALEKCLSKMSILEKTTLGWLIIFIKVMITYEAFSSMNLHNLALVFAPALFFLEERDPEEELSNLETKVALVKLCVQEPQLLFSDVLGEIFIEANGQDQEDEVKEAEHSVNLKRQVDYLKEELKQDIKLDTNTTLSEWFLKVKPSKDQ